MKRFAIGFTVLALLMLSVPASAVDLTGKFGIGAVGSYGMGFGDAYGEKTGTYNIAGMTELNWTSELKLGLGGAATFRYNFQPQLGIIAFADYQMLSEEVSLDWAPEMQGVTDMTVDEDIHWMGVHVDIAYYLMPEGSTMPYFMAGVGVYMFGETEQSAETVNKVGFNGGVGILHFFQPNIALDAGARFHMVPNVYQTLEEGEKEINTMADLDAAIVETSMTSLHFYAGLCIFFGGEQ